MNYILTLSVLFGAHLVANIADCRAKKGAASENGTLFSLHSRLYKEWSVKNITPEECGKIQHSFRQHKNMTKDIKRTLGESKKEAHKIAKTFATKSVKEIKKLRKIHEPDLSTLPKMSAKELRRLVEITKVVQGIGNKTAEQIWEMFNVTIYNLKTSLEVAANRTETFADIFIYKLKELTENLNTQIYCLVESGETEKAKRTSTTFDKEILKFSSYISKFLMGLYTMLAKSINKIASKAGEIIINQGKYNIKKITSINEKHLSFQKYVKFSVNRINQFTQHCKEKCVEIATEQLKKLEIEVERNAMVIKQLGTHEIKLNNAIANSNTEDRELLEDEINKIYKNLKQTKKKYSLHFVKAVSANIADVLQKSKEEQKFQFGLKRYPTSLI